MNDVLPKPFTKEGLLNMLEKHLSHLKKGINGMEALSQPPAQSIAQSSARQSLKDENSPGKSPATVTNWNSPTQITGMSPTTNNVTDEYMQAVRGHTSTYAMDGSMHHDGIQYQSPSTPMSGGRQGAHRRQISEISGSDDITHDVKRQQAFPPGHINPAVHAIHRGRPG